MTTTCQNCKADSQVYLCRKCIAELRAMLDQITWLWDQLLVTRTRQDRVSDDIGGRIRKTNQPINAFNAGAHQLSRNLQDMLQEWVVRLTEGGARQFLPALAVPTGFIGPLRPGWRRLPRGYGGEPPQQARWLTHHVNAIATRQDAGEFYNLMVDFVGERNDPRQQAQTPQTGHIGSLLRAINRKSTHYVGLCYTVVGVDYHRNPLYCRQALYRSPGQETVRCPECGQDIDVYENARKARVDNDLLAESDLIETMATIGEPIGRNRLYDWLREKRIEECGYSHMGEVVDKRIRKSDQRLFRLSQARALRAQDEDRKQRRQATA